MKYTTPIIGLAALLLAVGCTSTGSLPTGAKKVGGGLQIEWEAPSRGTAILLETTTGRTVATKSLSGGSLFEFDVTNNYDDDIIRSVFPIMPPNAQFILYFVPSFEKD